MAEEQDYERRISRIREVIDHPIVDADAHLVEPFPSFLRGFERSWVRTPRLISHGPVPHALLVDDRVASDVRRE